jgi:hypothetical protein
MLAELDLGNHVTDLAVEGNRLVVRRQTGLALDQMTIRVFDVRDPATPRRLGALDEPFSGRRLGLAGDMVWVSGPGSLQLVDLAEPMRPRLAGRLAVAGLEGDEPVVTQGERAWVGAFGRLLSFHADDPYHPRLLSENTRQQWALEHLPDGRLLTGFCGLAALAFGPDGRIQRAAELDQVMPSDGYCLRVRSARAAAGRIYATLSGGFGPGGLMVVAPSSP